MHYKLLCELNFFFHLMGILTHKKREYVQIEFVPIGGFRQKFILWCRCVCMCVANETEKSKNKSNYWQKWFIEHGFRAINNIKLWK